MKKSKSEISPVDDFWSENDSRKHGRRRYHKPLCFSYNSNEYKGLVANISPGGAYISIKEKLALGGRIEIAVKGRKIRQEFNITGWIIRISPEGIGVSFERRFGRERRSDLDRRTGSDRRRRKRRDLRS